MKDVIVEKIVFPADERHEAYWKLFYNCTRMIIDEGHMVIPAECVVDFATYLNGCPVNKWREYTGIDNLRLRLTVAGKFRVILTGYSLMPKMPVRKVYASEEYDFSEPQEISIDYPDISQDDFLAFEIVALSRTTIYGGNYSTQCDEEDLSEVNLCIATTTFKKEDYIKNNINNIRHDLLESNEDIRDHLFVNVVDNGRTLTKEEIESRNISLFYNDNVGGSGGFARGMIEALHREKEMTHVLLMDDDVLMLTESIRRTYILLKLVKEQYKSAFISGAMLELDSMYTMHEDIGLLKSEKSFYHFKPEYDVDELGDILEANSVFPSHKNTYAGWWYCCIPCNVIRDKGLPLPIFIRGDDVEYGIRCRPKIMTMTGICVWHLSFEGKYSAATNLYQEFRNVFIVKDATGLIPEVDVLWRWKNECFRSALTFDYDGWELLLLAMEDYLKGPDFIKKPNGTEILQRNKRYAEPMESLSDESTPDFYLEQVLEEEDIPRPLMQRAKYYLSYNGQRFLKNAVRDEIGLMCVEWDHKPGKNMFKDKLFVVDPVNRTGHLRKMDRVRFKELLKRQQKDMRMYNKCHGDLEREYRKCYPELTGEAFWREYLKI